MGKKIVAREAITLYVERQRGRPLEHGGDRLPAIGSALLTTAAQTVLPAELSAGCS